MFPWFSVSYFGNTWPQQDPVLETVVFHGPASRGDVRLLKLLLSAVNDVNVQVESSNCIFLLFSTDVISFMSNCISVCQSRLMLYLSNIKRQDGEGSSALHVVTEQLQEAAEEEAQNLVRRSTQLKKMTIIITLAMVVVQFP